MTPAARASAAIEILDRYLAGEPVEKALTTWARGSRFAGSGDRAAIRDLVFAALRNLHSYAALGGGRTGRGLIIGHFRAGGEDPDTIFSGERFAPAPLTPQERGHDPGALSEAEQWDCPDWLLPQLRDSLGDLFPPVMEALRHRAPVFVRVNLRKASVETALHSLAAEGIGAEPGPLSPTALRITHNERKVAGADARRNGWIEMQDAGSQWLADRLPVAGGDRVLDMCAGGGGKTLALAARCDAAFFAGDVNRQRLADLPARAARAGVSVRIVEAGEMAAFAPYDLVLCDVPCSGSGAWRRAPAGKWSLTRAMLTRLVGMQAEILEQAKGLVSDGGALAYATCSMLEAENGAQVTAFLRRNPGWRVAFRQSLTPLDGGDGFYLAVLKRNGDG